MNRLASFFVMFSFMLMSSLAVPAVAFAQDAFEVVPEIVVTEAPTTVIIVRPVPIIPQPDKVTVIENRNPVVSIPIPGVEEYGVDDNETPTVNKNTVHRSTVSRPPIKPTVVTPYRIPVPTNSKNIKTIVELVKTTTKPALSTTVSPNETVDTDSALKVPVVNKVSVAKKNVPQITRFVKKPVGLNLDSNAEKASFVQSKPVQLATTPESVSLFGNAANLVSGVLVFLIMVVFVVHSVLFSHPKG